MLGAVALLPEGCCTAKLLHGLHLCSLDGSVLLLEHVLRGPRGELRRAVVPGIAS